MKILSNFGEKIFRSASKFIFIAVERKKYHYSVFQNCLLVKIFLKAEFFQHKNENRNWDWQLDTVFIKFDVVREAFYDELVDSGNGFVIIFVFL